MRQSLERILVSHAGALPAPDDLMALVEQAPTDADALRRRLPSAVLEVVKRQVDLGVDVVNDGELSKRASRGGGFTYYAMRRLDGLREEPDPGGKVAASRSITARDARSFPGFHAQRVAGFSAASAARAGRASNVMVCAGPLAYIGQAQVAADIANLTAALDGHDVEGYLPAVAPGTIEHWLWNEHYRDDEELLYAVAEAMSEEYEAITAAGLIVQVDDPDLFDGWQMFPDMSVDDYRRYAEVRVEALNHALRRCPPELVRLHVCWGSGHGPHLNDLPVEHIVDVALKVRAGCFSIEAANPRHDHEWRVWEHTKLPEGMTLMPGVVGHCTDIVEHPRLVADRLVRYAGLVGRENVIAGTDCGLGTRVAHPEIAWAKLEAMVAGATLATKELWGAT